MIRTVSLCVIRREDELLLEETFDNNTSTTYYRPIGGTVEVGEDSKQTVIREIKEEINAEISEPKLLGVIENIFKVQDQIGHEIDFIYEATFLEASLYKQEEIKGVEGDKAYDAVWKSLRDLKDNQSIKLVPDGLAELLEEEGESTKISHLTTRPY
ncbi:NUDIX domain-containing protein [Paenibacillus illinoisensis]|uniref:NUDIX hydrolase n=1 Tax=Paenibacillus illinoisensis TaxID=59845 RepID=UPI003D287040